MFRIVIGVSAILAASPVIAQVRATPGTDSSANQEDEQPLFQQEQTPLETNQVGRTAQSMAGQIGQRQTRDTAATQAGIKPMARIASRIQNRVQNRIRNRIDSNYDPQANATDPFVVAGDQARTNEQAR
jgi:hypothetical protein